MHWKTDKIVEDLKKLPGVEEVKAYGPGGDYDTDNVIVSVIDSNDRLYVCGFPDNATKWQPCLSPSDTNPKYIEIKDGLDDRGGLNSKNKNLAKVYIEVRDYFLKHDGHVINTYEEVY